MVIDCHYHLEERILSIDGLIREMDRCGVHRTALIPSMVEPFREPPKFLIDALQFLLEQTALRSIGKIFISQFTGTGDVKILGRPYAIQTDPDNAKIFDTVEKYPDRFLGWIFVNPRGRNDQVEEFEKYKDRPGFIGVKAHPFWHHFDPVELLPVAERLARIGKPLLIHAGFGEENNIEALLSKVKDLKLVLAHAGFPEYKDLWTRIRSMGNVCLDLSQTSYTSERATRGAVECLGPDRLFFGTDGPYGFHGPDHKYDYGYLKRRIQRMFPDITVQEKLLGGSFAKFAGIEA